jgi:hypothetical protein
MKRSTSTDKNEMVEPLRLFHATQSYRQLPFFSRHSPGFPSAFPFVGIDIAHKFAGKLTPADAKFAKKIIIKYLDNHFSRC